jgi:hypothetical protein
LNPWAVAMRYDELEAELDREAALLVANASLTWARALVDAARDEPLSASDADPETRDS